MTNTIHNLRFVGCGLAVGSALVGLSLQYPLDAFMILPSFVGVGMMAAAHIMEARQEKVSK